MPAIEFNRYYRYDELTSLLRSFEKEYPDLVEMSSIGKSHEGKDIWLLTVTNKKTGVAADKPAFWSDGNIHASEVSASLSASAAPAARATSTASCAATSACSSRSAFMAARA